MGLCVSAFPRELLFFLLQSDRLLNVRDKQQEQQSPPAASSRCHREREIERDKVRLYCARECLVGCIRWVIHKEHRCSVRHVTSFVFRRRDRSFARTFARIALESVGYALQRTHLRCCRVVVASIPTRFRCCFLVRVISNLSSARGNRCGAIAITPSSLRFAPVHVSSALACAHGTIEKHRHACASEKSDRPGATALSRFARGARERERLPKSTLFSARVCAPPRLFFPFLAVFLFRFVSRRRKLYETNSFGGRRFGSAEKRKK